MIASDLVALRRVRRPALRRRGRHVSSRSRRSPASRPASSARRRTPRSRTSSPTKSSSNANSLLQTVETLVVDDRPGRRGRSWSRRGGRRCPYAVNAVTFLVSAASSPRSRSGASARGTRSRAATGATSPTGFASSSRRRRSARCSSSGTSRSSESAAVNVAEVVFAKETLDAGDVGFGALVAASGVGLAFGSFLSAPALGKVGLRRTTSARSCSWARAGAQLRSAARSGSQWRSSSAAPRGTARPSSATGCSSSGARPTSIRGRALATIMSSNYAVLGLAMAAAGVLTEQFGARGVWVGAGVVYLFAAVRRARPDALAARCGRGQNRARSRRAPSRRRCGPRHGNGNGHGHEHADRRADERRGARAGSSASRRLLEEIEARREELEARAPSGLARTPETRERRVECALRGAAGS